ncbi:MAG: hypothetical protein SchgKO_08990 [Schleiferiaceae bacterium]
MKPVEVYIDNLPVYKREAVLGLVQCIESEVPQAELFLKYGIPYFYLEKPYCYLNPKEKGIDLGFHKGQQLTSPHVLKAGRKLVGSLFFPYDEEWNIEVLNEVLEEALGLQKAPLRNRK